jgi:hypothetical protein
MAAYIVVVWPENSPLPDFCVIPAGMLRHGGMTENEQTVAEHTVRFLQRNNLENWKKWRKEQDDYLDNAFRDAHADSPQPAPQQKQQPTNGAGGDARRPQEKP